MNDSCLDNVIVSIPENDVVEEIPVDTAIVVLEKEVSASAGVNDVVSKKKKRKPKHSSSECGVNSVEEDNVIVSIPETDVLENVPSNLTTSVLEKEVFGEVNNVVSKKKNRKHKHSFVSVSIPETDVVEEVPSNLTTSVLENDGSAGVNNVVSKKKRKPKRNSPESGVNSIKQDNVSVSIPETDVLEEVPSNLITSVLEKDVSAGVNDIVSKKKKRKPKRNSSECSVNSLAQDSVSVSIPESYVLEEVPSNLTTSVLEMDVSAGVNDLVLKKKKRKPKRNSSECGVNSVAEDSVSVNIPESYVLEEVPSHLITSVLENDVSSEVNNVISKKKKRKRSTVGVLEKEVLAGVNVVEPKGNSVEMICLDNVSVGIPKTDVIEEVPVQSNLTSSGEELHISPVDTTISVLVKDVSAFGGVNDVVSKKRKRKLKRLDNVSVGIPKTDVLEEVPVESNLTSSGDNLLVSPVDSMMGVLEKEVSGAGNVVVPKKKKRKPKRSSIEMTCLDNVNVGIPKTEGLEEVPAQLNLTSSCEKLHISPVDSTMGVLDKEVSASDGVNDVVSKKKKRKLKRLDNVSVGTPKTDVVEEVPVDTAIVVLEKEVSASAGVNDVVSKKKKRKPKHSSSECGVNSVVEDNVIVSIPETNVLENVPSNLTTSVLEKEVFGEVNNVVSKKKNRKHRHSFVSVSIPETDVVEEVPSNLTTSVLENDVSAGVNNVVSKKKRKPKRNSPECGVNSIKQDNVSVSIPETDVLEEVPSNLITSVLEKDVSAGVNDIVSKKKKRKPKRNSSECSVNSLAQDSVSVSIPESYVLEEVPSNLTTSVLEMDVSAGVNDLVLKKKKRKPKRNSSECGVNSLAEDSVSVNIPEFYVLEEVPSHLITSVLENDVSGEVNNVISKKKKRKRSTVGVLEKEVLAGVNVVEPKGNSVEMTCLDNVSVGIPKTDVVEEVPVQSNLTSSGEEVHISPVDTTISVLVNDVSAFSGVNDVVSKKTKRKLKRLDNVSVGIPKTDVLEEVPVESNLTSSGNNLLVSPVDSTMGVLEKEVSGPGNVVVSKKEKRKPKRSSIEMTCLDNVNVGIPKTEGLEEVPAQLNLTSSCEKLHISPVDTTMGVLDKEVSASDGVNDVVSKKRKRKLKRLDNVSVGTPITDVLEEVPVQSNLTSSPEKFHISPVDTTMCVLEKEVLCGVNVLVSKKRKRKSKLKEMNDCSSIERTCLDNVSVKPVSGVTDNISVCDINNDVMASDHPVVTCSVNVDSNGKSEEAKDVGVIPPEKSKRKHQSCSSSEVINPSLQLSQPLDTTAILKSRKKLLILDVNGLLADIVPQCPKRFKPDFTLAKKKVFKRPFCDDFLQFCFEKFNVGIWSSRTKKNLTRAVDLLMNNMKDKLCFCWDGSHCTKTGFKTLKDKHKPLVLKELKKLWEDKANRLPSQRFYNQSNTILLDDSPYKALRNPPYTAIHPRPYSFTNVGDKSLGPDGDLRLYLERLAEAKNVQNFIRANPFGQKPITQAHPSWNFYSKIVRKTQQEKRNVITSTGPDFSLHHL